MKRGRPLEWSIRDDAVAVADRDPSPWSILSGDLVCLLVCTAPVLLPALYFLNHHFHATLDSAPPPVWEAYWRRVLTAPPTRGYSGYKPNPPALQWRDLVRGFSTLVPRLVLIVEWPRYTCGQMRPEGGIHHLMCPTCNQHWDVHHVEEWVTLRKPIKQLTPTTFLNEPCQQLTFDDDTTRIGSFYSTADEEGSYVWSPLWDRVRRTCGIAYRFCAVAMPALELESWRERSYRRLNCARFVGVI